ncbi:MAG: hypothetical protein ACOYMZ_02105 [Minisyncoccia bacterium]
MKKALNLFILLFALATVSVQAQNMKPEPTRSGLNLYFNQHTLEKSDTQYAMDYAPGRELILVKITDTKNNDTFTFQCTPDELLFLQNQLKKENIQIVLDDKVFMGFVKIRQ